VKLVDSEIVVELAPSDAAAATDTMAYVDVA
jgi:hypothetical protein